MWASGCSPKLLASALMGCLQDSFLSSECSDSDCKALIQREREIEKEGRGRERGRKRKTPWAQSLLCFGSASHGVVCKPFKLSYKQDQDHRFSTAGSLPDCRIWCLGPPVAFTLGAAGRDCAVLELFLKPSTGLVCGHPK